VLKRYWILIGGGLLTIFVIGNNLRLGPGDPVAWLAGLLTVGITAAVWIGSREEDAPPESTTPPPQR
jgi:hypothetical protein